MGCSRGIVGIYNIDGKPVEPKSLQHMVDRLAYRGPDRQSILIKDYVGFGHTLFRTTYESVNEQQPYTLDDKVLITADARIDSRNTLISLLKSKGCNVSHDLPDVNLILHAYQVWNEDCVKYLLGDFVFAIWDKKEEKLFCARDHFGVRVLYYTYSVNSLVFSNTLNCLRSYPGTTNKLNEQSIGDFLLFGTHTWIDKSSTIFADIHKLPPAHTLTWNHSGLKVKRYWDIPLNVPVLNYRFGK